MRTGGGGRATKRPEQCGTKAAGSKGASGHAVRDLVVHCAAVRLFQDLRPETGAAECLGHCKCVRNVRRCAEWEMLPESFFRRAPGWRRMEGVPAWQSTRPNGSQYSSAKAMRGICEPQRATSTSAWGAS